MLDAMFPNAESDEDDSEPESVWEDAAGVNAAAPPEIPASPDIHQGEQRHRAGYTNVGSEAAERRRASSRTTHTTSENDEQ